MADRGLVLTRKLGESIHIDDRIVVKVEEIRGAQVRIRIVAPRTMGVWREEKSPANPLDACAMCGTPRLDHDNVRHAFVPPLRDTEA